LKTETKTHNIIKTDVNPSEEEDFVIDNNPMAYEILSNGIYSNKIGAVCRELGTNAFDSHYDVTEAELISEFSEAIQSKIADLRAKLIEKHVDRSTGKPIPLITIDQLDRTDEQRKLISSIMNQLEKATPSKKDVIANMKPFHVHLPNSNEPWFSVKDFGTGLSHEDALSLYRTYFKSDKRDTNNKNGCFGLGSKAPLAYADSFQVTSIFKGTKSIYSIYLSENRRPKISRQYEEQTDEPNGVEIQLPVESVDFYEFSKQAEKIYKWFEVRPTVGGSSSFEYPVFDYLYETDKYKINKGRNSYETSYVVMANVAYPVLVQDLKETTRAELTSVEKMLLGHGVVVNAEHGGVLPSTSREKLQMTPRTIKTIKKLLNSISDHIENDIREKVNECENVWEAQILYNEVIHDTIISDIIEKNNSDPIDYDGERLKSKIELYKSIEEKVSLGITDGVEEFETLKKRVRRVNCRTFRLTQSRRWNDSIGGYKQLLKKEETATIYPQREIEVFVDDLDSRGAMARLKKYAEDKSLTKKPMYLLKESIDYDLDQFLLETGLVEVVRYASELEAPPKAVRQGRKGSGGTGHRTAKAVACTGTFHCSESTSWEDAEIDWEEGGVYVEINRYKWRAGVLGNEYDNEEFVSPANLHNYYRAIGELCPDVKIIGLRAALSKKAKKHDQWIRLDDWVGEEIEKYHYLAETNARYKIYHQFKCDSRDEFIGLFGQEVYSKDSPMGEFLEHLVEIRDLSDDEHLSGYSLVKQYFEDKLNLSFPEPSDYSDELKELESQWGKLYGFYPMLSMIRWDRIYSSNDHKSKLVHYVKIVDKNIELQEQTRLKITA